MESNQLTNKINNQININFDFRRLLASFAANWYWFLISIGLFAGSGFLYLRYATPVYVVKSALLLELGGGDNAGKSVLSDIGIKKDDVNIYNEIFILRSQDLIRQVVDSLDLNIHYWVKGRIKENEIYGEAPVRLVFDSNGFYGGRPVDMIVRQIVEGQFELTEEGRQTRIAYEAWVERPYGRFKIVYAPGGGGNKGYLNEAIKIHIAPVMAAVREIIPRLRINMSDGRTSMLDLRYEDILPERGVAFMQALIWFYHRNELQNINRFAQKTREFISQRQADLMGDIKNVDSKVENIKVSHGMVDVSSQANTYVAGRTQAEQQLEDIIIKKQAIAYLKQTVQEQHSGRHQMMAGIGIADPVVNALIGQYNTLVQKLETQDLPLSNPFRIQAESEIANLRKRIIDASDKVLASLEIAQKNAARNASEFSSLIRSVPSIDRSITDVKREYNVLQSMYLMLYQKGVENEIALYAASNKSKEIVAPYYEQTPVTPVPNTTYTMLLMMGVLIPAGVLATRELLNNKILNEREIEQLTSVPVIGSVSKARENTDIVTGERVRTGIAEQFRLIRANLEFMNAADRKKVIMITSSMSGEGKTFISINLALTLALAGKRVIVMEFDLRKPKISERLNLSREGGISGYLAGMTEIEQVIKPSGIHENLFVANCGPVPPNPGELLLLPKNEALISGLQQLFDIIVIDTAPVGMVSDALTLSRFAGVNLFVTRQGHTIKEQVRMLDGLYKEGKVRNAAIVFNGVEHQKRYGYGYGGYGYGYGYGYGSQGYYEDDEQEPAGLFKGKRKKK